MLVILLYNTALDATKYSRNVNINTITVSAHPNLANKEYRRTDRLCDTGLVGSKNKKQTNKQTTLDSKKNKN